MRSVDGRQITIGTTIIAMPPLVIENARKRFPNGVVALDDLSLQVGDGELLSVVGPSGSGKTTLLRCIAGLERLDAGTIRLGNQLLNGLPPWRRDVALMFERPALYPHLTVRNNVAFPLRMRAALPTVIENQVDEIAGRLGIESLLDRRPDQLSAGQAQRVAFARALVRRPRCLLLDEPLSNLDAPLRADLRLELKSLQEAMSITTIYVTHDQDEAFALGHRVAIMDKGRWQQIGLPNEIISQPANEFVVNFFRHLRGK
jgi:multiple sugar transport system ATP-binding protein